MLATMLIWALVGALLGFLWVALVPWVTARALGLEAIEKVSDWYLWLAQSCISKSALVPRPGTIDLVAKRYDAEQKADKDTAGSEPRHHYNSFGGLRSIANKPFGIAPYNIDEYVSPLLAEIAEKTKELHEREELGPSNSDEGVMLDGVPIERRSKLIDVTKARDATTGSADPESGHRAFKKTDISQERFHEKMTFGQTVTIIGALVVSMVVAWLLASRDAPSGATESISFIMLAIPALGLDKDDIRKGGVILAAVLGSLVVPVIALLTYGFLAAFITFGAAVVVAGIWVGGIALMGPSLPIFLGQPLAMIHWTLAQLTVGQGVIVERDTGQFEHHRLNEYPDGQGISPDYWAQLSDGGVIDIDGSPGDLLRFGWAPLGITAEKSDENMAAISSTPTEEALTDGGHLEPKNQRQGWQPKFPADRLEADWMVTLPQIYKWCQGSAESQAVREGRDTALVNKGGQQQLSYVVYLGILLFSMVSGGFIGLIAGGAIL